jgi:hypothetical protein
MVRSLSSGLKVAARLSPPDSMNTMSALGNSLSMRSTASRLMEQSSRMAVCGQPPVSTPRMRSAPARRHGQQALVFLGVDVVGDDDEVVAHRAWSCTASPPAWSCPSPPGRRRPRAGGQVLGAVGDVVQCAGVHGGHLLCNEACLRLSNGALRSGKGASTAPRAARSGWPAWGVGLALICRAAARRGLHGRRDGLHPAAPACAGLRSGPAARP